MNTGQIEAVKARLGSMEKTVSKRGKRATSTGFVAVDEFLNHAPADIRALLAEVERMTMERDHAQIDLTATTQTCRDMEATIDRVTALEMLRKMRELFDYRVDHGCATATELELICEHDALLKRMGG